MKRFQSTLARCQTSSRTRFLDARCTTRIPGRQCRRRPAVDVEHGELVPRRVHCVLDGLPSCARLGRSLEARPCGRVVPFLVLEVRHAPCHMSKRVSSGPGLGDAAVFPEAARFLALHLEVVAIYPFLRFRRDLLAVRPLLPPAQDDVGTTQLAAVVFLVVVVTCNLHVSRKLMTPPNLLFTLLLSRSAAILLSMFFSKSLTFWRNMVPIIARTSLRAASGVCYGRRGDDFRSSPLMSSSSWTRFRGTDPGASSPSSVLCLFNCLPRAPLLLVPMGVDEWEAGVYPYCRCSPCVLMPKSLMRWVGLLVVTCFGSPISPNTPCRKICVSSHSM